MYDGDTWFVAEWGSPGNQEFEDAFSRPDNNLLVTSDTTRAGYNSLSLIQVFIYRCKQCSLSLVAELRCFKHSTHTNTQTRTHACTDTHTHTHSRTYCDFLLNSCFLLAVCDVVTVLVWVRRVEHRVCMCMCAPETCLI